MVDLRMNNERKQRILTKVAGLPRALANIAKKVIAANPRATPLNMGRANTLNKLAPDSKFGTDRMVGGVASSRAPTTGLENPSPLRIMRGWEIPAQRRIKSHLLGRTNNYTQERGRHGQKGLTLSDWRHGGKSRWSPIGMGGSRTHLRAPDITKTFRSFDQAAENLATKAKAKRDAIKHTPWGNWGKFKTRDLRPSPTEREAWDAATRRLATRRLR